VWDWLDKPQLLPAKIHNWQLARELTGWSGDFSCVINFIFKGHMELLTLTYFFIGVRELKVRHNIIPDW
jgi:hypothetical protein